MLKLNCENSWTVVANPRGGAPEHFHAGQRSEALSHCPDKDILAASARHYENLPGSPFRSKQNSCE